MHLKSLELAGFKSFAKKTALDFKTSISAIVGPNGSGKSNVAEAFSFVLGEQSIKSLRGKKTEDLIFNGSKDLPRGNRASVKLIFDNHRRLFNLDYDEVILERVIYRDSSSEYLINGTQVRLRDIIELLASAHIGASGHQIISQGEADRVLTANPKERRAMVEDALGLKIHQYKRQESERKLLKTEENIKQVESLRKEIAPHLRFLKKQVEKVEKALAMKEELKMLYKDYLRREDIYLSHEKKAITEARREPAHKLKALEEELEKVKETVASSKGRDEKSDQLISLESNLQNSRKEKERLTREIGRLEGMIDFERRRIEKAKKLAETQSDTTVPVSAVESLVSEIKNKASPAEVEENISNLRGLIRNLLARLDKFVKESRNLSGQMETDELKAEIKDLEEKKQILEKELREIISVEERQQKDYGYIKDSIEKEKDVNREAEKAIFRIMASQNELHAIMQAIQTKEDKLVIEETNFKREIQEGLVLVGREVSIFHDFSPTDSVDRVLSGAEIARELREKQEERRRVIEKIKIRLEDSGGGSSDEIMKEYQDVSGRDEFLTRELADLEKSSITLKELIKDLELRLDEEFKTGVTKINRQFQDFFSLMFGGGHASLQVIREVKRKPKDEGLAGLLEGESMLIPEEEAEDEGKEGLDIQVSLPHKKVKGLVMLSGGERALTSIALIFAISQVNPPPFIILDETDAALDEANSRKYGDMIESLAKHSQLILITHNRETMSRAGVLYGVTMASGGDSKLLSVEFEEAVAVAK